MPPNAETLAMTPAFLGAIVRVARGDEHVHGEDGTRRGNRETWA